MTTFFAYLATLIPLTALDAIWLLVVAKRFYADQLGFLFSKTINLAPIAIFYPLYAVGVLVFAVLPALNAASWVEALWRGALLGLVAYGAYDLTNQATIAGWPLVVTLVDLAWGMTVTALTSLAAYLIITTLK